MADKQSEHLESKNADVSDHETKPDGVPATSRGEDDVAHEPLKWIYREIYKRFGKLGVAGASIALFLITVAVGSVVSQSVGPISCQMPKPLPHADSKAFAVVVARLELDEENRYQRLIVEAMDDFAGVQILPIDRTISFSDGTLHDSVRSGHKMAQEYLRKTGADILVWGVLLQGASTAPPRLKLHLTPSINIEGVTGTKGDGIAAGKYHFTDDYSLPALFFQDLMTVLRLVVATYESGMTPFGNFPSNDLESFTASVRELLIEGEPYLDEDARNHMRMILADALVAGQESRRDQLEEAAQLYGRVLETLDADDTYHETKFVYAQNGLGLALMNLSKNDSDVTQLRSALSSFDRILEVVTPEDGISWARAQFNRGATLRSLGERDRGNTILEESIDVIRSSLDGFKDDPLMTAYVRTALGTSLLILNERRRDATLAREVISLFRSVLSQISREAVPEMWGNTQMELGNALFDLSEIENNEDLRLEAVTALREAIRALSREGAPIKWAGAHNNLGNVLLEIGTHGPRKWDRGILNESLRSFEQALDVFDRETDPILWAGARMGHGRALIIVGWLERSPDRLCQAFESQLSAWEIFHRANHPKVTAAKFIVQESLGLLQNVLRTDDAAACLMPLRERIDDFERSSVEQ